jgi:hypothetical protein
MLSYKCRLVVILEKALLQPFQGRKPPARGRGPERHILGTGFAPATESEQEL